LTKLYRVVLVLVVMFLLAGCDQATKSVARSTLVDAPPIFLLNNTVRIQYAENPGAMLGLGAEVPANLKLIFLLVFVTAIVATTLYMAVRSHSLSLLQLSGMAMLAAGGLGNLFDRVFNNGLVVDFMQIGVGPLKTGIFNVADMSITAGVVLLVLASATQPAEHEQGP
jgi:signal peptidase II